MKEKTIDLTKNETVEYYINGKLYRKCPYSRWNKTDDIINRTLDEKGYIEIWSDSFMNNECIPFHSKVYINLKKEKCIVVGYKINTGLVDKRGNSIYHDDVIQDSEGRRSDVNMHYNNKTYYVRFPKYEEWYGQKYERRHIDINLTDFSEWEKVEDALKIPKKFWKQPQRTKL